MGRLNLAQQLRTRALGHVYANDQKIGSACKLCPERCRDMNAIASAAQPFLQ
jgi:hypothetical protein